MSRRTKAWLVALVALLALSLGIGRAVLGKRASAAASAVAASAPAQAVELTAADLASVRRADLRSTLEVSGGLKAVNSAVVKAKVAAELTTLAVREGDPVQAGQLIGRLDDTESRWRLRQAEDQAAAAQAQLEIAERTLANNKALVDQGFISRTALDTSVSSANGARASLQAAKAAIELARKAVNDCELRAPLAGLVSQRLAQPGERVPLDGRVVEIVDLARLELEAAIAPDDVVRLRVGQTARLQVDGLAETVPATVARINPATQGGTRAVMAYLAVQAVPGLRQGLFGRGVVELSQRPALVAPAAALRSDQALPDLLMVVDGRVARRPVTTGARGEVDFGAGPERAIELLKGAAEGDRVLRASVGMLPAGTALVLPKAAATSSATPAVAPAAASAASR